MERNFGGIGKSLAAKEKEEQGTHLHPVASPHASWPVRGTITRIRKIQSCPSFVSATGRLQTKNTVLGAVAGSMNDRGACRGSFK